MAARRDPSQSELSGGFMAARRDPSQSELSGGFMAARRDPSQSGTLNLQEYASRAAFARRLASGPFSTGCRLLSVGCGLAGRRRCGLHGEEAGGGTREHFAGLKILQGALDVYVLRRGLDGAATAQDWAIQRRELEVTHGELSGDVGPAGVG